MSRSALLLVTLFALAAPGAAAQEGWGSAPIPLPRCQHAMAYDNTRGRVVLFGGLGSNGSKVDDTWEWDGTTWILRATSGPSARSGHAMTYDTARGRIVLFGGNDGVSKLNDTWEWDGTSWTQRAASGPAPRDSHAMAYDAAIGRVVLFGGLGANSGPDLNDTWEWDGTTWTQRATSGPSARLGHAMTYDTARGRVVLFGGYGYLGDTWEYDGSAWTQRATSGPMARARHAMAYDSARKRVVLFGGIDGIYLGDTWEWNGTTWTQVANTGPAPMWGHAIAYDIARGQVVLFGGTPHDGSPVVGDTWEYDGSAWTQRATSGPSSRDLHAMAYDSAGDRVVLFGGLVPNGSNVNDTWVYHGSAWTQRATSGPSARDGHAMAYDSARERVVLFGGYSNDASSFNDTWEWDGSFWVKKIPSPPIPLPRAEHAMAYDSARGRVVLFGGWVWSGGGEAFGDTWEWSGARWVQRATAGPSPRRGHAMAYDATRNRVVLFGGSPSYTTNNYGDTWEWDGATWTQRATSGPSPRHGHAMAYDSVRGRVVLFGGYGGSQLNDTWEWDGTTWTQRATSGPSPRTGHAMAYDSARERVVLFGGSNAYYRLNDTWEYSMCAASEQRGYGMHLFDPLCTRDASGLPQVVYNSGSFGIFKGPNDGFFLSSQAKQFSPLVVEDTVHINGFDSDLGPYSFQPGIPPYLVGVPIDRNVQPLPAHDVTSFVPAGSSSVFFELLDTRGAIYGNTALYLVRDCGIWLDKDTTGRTRLNWVSRQVQVGGSQSNLDVVSGRLSQLRADGNFSRSCFLGTYLNTTQVVDTRSAPPVGDGYYYLESGTCASPIGYGNSSQGPRVGLPPTIPCP